MSRVRYHSAIVFMAFALGLIPGCKTGSNYERLKDAKLVSVAPFSASGPATKTYLIRPFTFAEIGDRTEMFRKAFIVPGYKGIDFDTYGRMDPVDQKTGMKTIYSMPDVHQLVATELSNLKFSVVTDENAAPEITGTLDVKVLGSESSLRMHTYGCWPVVGMIIYIFNADVYTVATKTKLAYSVTPLAGNAQGGNLEIYSEMDFSFWGTYMGFDIYESFETAQAAHLKDVATKLAIEIGK